MQEMDDKSRIKANVQKMVDAKAPVEEIDNYLEMEGVSLSDFQSWNKKPTTWDDPAVSSEDITDIVRQPFRDTEWGLPDEVREQYVDNPNRMGHPLANAMREGGFRTVDTIYRGFQGLGATSDSLIKYFISSLPTDTKGKRDAYQDINDLLVTTGFVAPNPTALTRGSVVSRASGGAKNPSFKYVGDEGIPMSRGEQGRDVMQQSFEQAALSGTEGRGALDVMKAHKDRQNQALMNKADELKMKASGRDFPSTQYARGQGSMEGVSTMQDIATRARKRIKDAYDEAQSLNAEVDSKIIQDFSNDMKKLLMEESFDIEVMPSLARRFKDLDNIDYGLRLPASIKEIEKIRKRMVNDIEDVKITKRSEATALRKLRDGLDDQVAAALDEGLVRGDAGAVEALNRARGLRAAYGKTFEREKFIKDIVEGEWTPETAIAKVFGAAKVGFDKNAGLGLKKIKEIIGGDTPAWGALREEAVLKLMGNQSDDVFNGKLFHNAFTTAMKRNPTTMKTLFTNGELSQMRRFANASRKATTPDLAGMNPPQSAFMADKLRQRAEAFPVLGDAVKRYNEFRRTSKATDQARQAVGDAPIKWEMAVRQHPSPILYQTLKPILAAELLQENEIMQNYNNLIGQ